MSVTIATVTGLCGPVVPKVRAIFDKGKDLSKLIEWLDQLDPTGPPAHLRFSVDEKWFGGLQLTHALERGLPQDKKFVKARSYIDICLLLPSDPLFWSREYDAETLASVQLVAKAAELALNQKQFGGFAPLCCIIHLSCIDASPLDDDFHMYDQSIESISGEGRQTS